MPVSTFDQDVENWGPSNALSNNKRLKSPLNEVGKINVKSALSPLSTITSSSRVNSPTFNTSHHGKSSNPKSPVKRKRLHDEDDFSKPASPCAARTPRANDATCARQSQLDHEEDMHSQSEQAADHDEDWGDIFSTSIPADTDFSTATPVDTTDVNRQDYFYDTSPGVVTGPPMSAKLGHLESSLVVFDWDDTLLPSTYLSGLGYRLDIENQEFNDELAQRLLELEGIIITILEAFINEVGAERVVIITNAERGWVELSAQKFIPGVIPTIQRCHIISARSTFEVPQTGPFDWKILAFYHKIQQSFGITIPPPRVLPKDSPYHQFLTNLYTSRTSKGIETKLFPSTKDMSTKSICIPREQSECVAPGGGTTNECIKEENRQGGDINGDSECRSVIVPKALLLDDQNSLEAKHCGDIFSDAEDAVFIDPWHLHDAGLEFEINPRHEEMIDRSKYVISLGDSLAEKHAALQVTSEMHKTSVKSVKFMERPDIVDVIRQLKLVTTHINYLVECETALDLILKL